MNATKAAATVCLLGLAAISVFLTVIAPWYINESKKAIEQTTVALIRSGNPLGAVTTIRRNLERLDSAARLTPIDVELYMLRAANLRLLNRTEDAIRSYHTALLYDRRPEIYFNLGSVLLDAHQQKEGVENLALAARFRSDYLELIQEPSIREMVRKAVAVH